MNRFSIALALVVTAHCLSAIPAQHIQDPERSSSDARLEELRAELGGTVTVDALHSFLYRKYKAKCLQLAPGADVTLYQQAQDGTLPDTFFLGQAARL